MCRVLLAAGLAFGWCVTSVAEVTLSPLEEITWSILADVDDVTKVPLAVALSAQGKRININYVDIGVSEAPTYDSPLEACAAAIRAGIEINETWWGDLSAPWAFRDSNGIPLQSYVADSGENMFRAFTYHTVDSQFPKMTGAIIKTYLRIGGIHVFDIEWTQVAGGTTTSGERFIFTFEQGISGHFRLAPEWMTPVGAVKDFLANTEPEDPTLAAYRTEVPTRSHSFSVFGLFGGDSSNFPLNIHYRGGAPEQSTQFTALESFRASYTSAVRQIPKAPEEFLGSAARAELAGLLTGNGLQMLDEQDQVGRMYNPSQTPFGFVIESPNFVLAFIRDPRNNVVGPGFLELYKSGEDFKWADFRTITTLDQFLGKDPVWSKLAESIQASL